MQSNKTEWLLSPYMVETAYNYCEAAKVLYPLGNLGQVAVINAALSIEILLKSFNSSIEANEGELNEKYNFDRSKLPNRVNGHDLIQLYKLLPTEVKDKFHDNFTLEMLEKYKHTFTSDRYFYEPKASSGYSGVLIGIAEKLINITVSIYRERGCTDIWIVNYPNVSSISFD